MRTSLSNLAAVFVCLAASAAAGRGTDSEPVPVRQSVASARDLYQQAVNEFAAGDDGALLTLRKACRRYDEAVEGDPADVELFIERCRAKRLLAEKVDPNDGRVVDKSQEWLIGQQDRAGNWTFANESSSKESAAEIGTPDSSKATAIALLGMFGAGQSQREGRWSQEIESGLTFLVSEARVDADGLDLRGANGNIVTQAIATMLLCEACEVTDDPRLVEPAQQSVKLLESLQYPDEGGWGVVGDDGPQMMPTAWCLMALQSAKRAGLRVEPSTRHRVEKFLDRVQTRDGAFYGEIKAGKEPRATAAGLLCRCLLGWTRKNTALVEGAEYLATPGVIGDDVEARFFTTQVMFHVGGNQWRKWNRETRDLLIASQARDGKDQGSWRFEKDTDSENRSRLWHTAVSLLTLEVYYRYLEAFKGADWRGLVEIETDNRE